jgi:hypothetical protein
MMKTFCWCYLSILNITKQKKMICIAQKVAETIKMIYQIHIFEKMKTETG